MIKNNWKFNLISLLEKNLFQQFSEKKMRLGDMKSLRMMTILMILFYIQIIKVMFFIKNFLMIRLKKFIKKFSILKNKFLHLYNL
jgi:hypothetical protein